MMLVGLTRSYRRICHGRTHYNNILSLHQQQNMFGNSIEQENSNRTIISWYPGHIAKAERELSDYLKLVDVVIEVRDARIPISTTHPMVPSWVGQKPLIVAIARQDMISKAALNDWREYYAHNPAHVDRPDTKVFFIDGKLGSGIISLKRKALEAGIKINQKRLQKGIQPRAVRAAVIGFPNVGKSALINRLLARKLARSQNLPGVTRSMQWIRVGGLDGPQGNVLELLDSPGIIPARQFDQHSALRLAICNDIGEASYDRVVVAAAMCDEINRLHKVHPRYVDMEQIVRRYKFPFHEMTGDEIVHEFAERVYRGNSISAADKLLGDFRRGMLTYGSLEAPSYALNMNSKNTNNKSISHPEIKLRKEIEDLRKGKIPFVDNPLEIGKGQFDGW
jgi:ribosome biogenesis GTPase A